MKRRKPRTYARALIVVPVADVLTQVEHASLDAQRLALAKRAVERRLRASGMSKSEAIRITGAMPHAELLKVPL